MAYTYSYPYAQSTEYEEPCRCLFTRYPPNDPLRRLWRMQVTSICKVHWPLMTWGQRLNILRGEKLLWLENPDG